MTIMRKILASASLVLALGVGAAFAHGFKVGDLKIGHPHGPAMLEGAKVAGGYLTVTNEGSTDDRLVSVTSERAGEVQLHEMSMENDVMKMRQLTDGIPVPAGQTVELKAGGLHVMFLNVAQPFAEGEKVKATLVFEKAGPVDVEFKIDPPKGAGGHDAHADHGAEQPE